MREEKMSDQFTKYHLGNGYALHHFTGPDIGGPHDHPWDFSSQILIGSYVERLYPSRELIHRTPGAPFHITAEHAHEIVELPEGECWTLVFAQPPRREVQWYAY